MKALLFSVSGELFAAPLSSIEESIDQPVIFSMPGADEHAVGVIDVRGKKIAAYSPFAALNVQLEGKPGAALVIEGEESKIAILVSDVDDVLDIDPTDIRIAPGAEDPDGVLIGVVQRAGRLISVVEAAAIRDVSLGGATKR